MISVKQFVEYYNRNIDWNIEIRKELGLSEKMYELAGQLIDDWLDDKKIVDIEYDLEHAKIYEPFEDRKYEMQVYSYETGSNVYFWCKPSLTKEQYTNERVKIINDEINTRCTDCKKTLDEVTRNYTAYAMMLHRTRFVLTMNKHK